MLKLTDADRQALVGLEKRAWGLEEAANALHNWGSLASQTAKAHPWATGAGAVGALGTLGVGKLLLRRAGQTAGRGMVEGAGKAVGNFMRPVGQFITQHPVATVAGAGAGGYLLGKNSSVENHRLLQEIWMSKMAQEFKAPVEDVPDDVIQNPELTGERLSEMAQKARKRMTLKKTAKQLAFLQMLRSGLHGGPFPIQANPATKKTLTAQAQDPKASAADLKEFFKTAQRTPPSAAPAAIKGGEGEKVTKFNTKKQDTVRPVRLGMGNK